MNLETLQGRPVLVNFWASGCIPCVREFPLLARALADNTRLIVVGVAVLDRRADALKFLEARGKPWDSILDRDAQVALRWRVRVLPVTYAIAPDGRIADRQFGELTEATLARMIAGAAATT